MDQPSVRQARELLARAAVEDLPEVIARFQRDSRAGVRDAVRSAGRRLDRDRAERARLVALGALENELRARGFARIAGVDEVGRGALAGPLTAGAVVLPPGCFICGLDDSKRLTPQRRESLCIEIRAAALAWSVAHVSNEEIDTLGIAQATRRAMVLAVRGLDPEPDHVIVDGLGAGIGIAETPVVGGDGRVAAVAAASILAKVARDALMVSYHQTYPDYGFCVNKGYGTSEHVVALASSGPCAIHRRTFAPCTDAPQLF